MTVYPQVYQCKLKKCSTFFKFIVNFIFGLKEHSSLDLFLTSCKSVREVFFLF